MDNALANIIPRKSVLNSLPTYSCDFHEHIIDPILLDYKTKSIIPVNTYGCYSWNPWHWGSSFDGRRGDARQAFSTWTKTFWEWHIPSVDDSSIFYSLRHVNLVNHFIRVATLEVWKRSRLLIQCQLIKTRFDLPSNLSIGINNVTSTR